MKGRPLFDKQTSTGNRESISLQIYLLCCKDDVSWQIMQRPANPIPNTWEILLKIHNQISLAKGKFQTRATSACSLRQTRMNTKFSSGTASPARVPQGFEIRPSCKLDMAIQLQLQPNLGLWKDLQQAQSTGFWAVGGCVIESLTLYDSKVQIFPSTYKTFASFSKDDLATKKMMFHSAVEVD